ncbi:MAG: hypothetical protein WC023_15780, partial [Rhodocyclaceae bacterium]
QPIRDIAEALIDMHVTLAACYQRAASAAASSQQSSVRRDVPLLCTCALRHFVRQFEVSLLVAAPAPAGMWSWVQKLHYLMRESFSPEETLPGSTALADKLVKEMLALAAAQPEGLTPRETNFLFHFLARYATAVDISGRLPTVAGDWFWLKETRDQPPMAVVRRAPPLEGRMLFFSCAELGHNTQALLARLAADEPPDKMGLPAEAQLPAYIKVLKRAQARWGVPAKRQFPRRHKSHRVAVCTNPGMLWQILQGDTTLDDDAISDWMVLNESPEGFAVMHVTGLVTGLITGSALGLRVASDQPWSICIVRWARSENSEHIEIGLELVGPSAEPVHVAAHTSLSGESPLAALLLPPMPRLQRGETLLTARGLYHQGRFSLIQDHPRLRISECEPGKLAVETSSIELFEFRRDPGKLT